MPFANTEKQKFSSSRKIVYMGFEPGSYSIRILNDTSKDFYTHYINRSTVKCLGEDCPICKNNQTIIMENPNNFREIHGYFPRTRRYSVNVLDKTQVRKCPKCSTENPSLPGKDFSCVACKEMLGGVTPVPSNTVKVLAKGVSLFDQLNSIDMAILDDKGEPIGINNYDITLIVNGTGKSRIITAVPQPQSNTPVPDGLELYDLDNTVITLNPEEMLELSRGISLRDLFAARRAESAETDLKEASHSEEVNSKVAELFKN